MKKRIKRNNYILFGAIAVAAVALSGVGFATWITGMQKTTTDVNITNIEVDTAKNDTLYIDAALEDSIISVKQINADNGSGKLSATGNTNDKDFKIKFSKFKVYVSDKYKASTVNVTMAVSFSEGANLHYTNKGIAKVGTEYTYISLPEVLTGSEGVTLSDDTNSIAGYTCKTLSSLELEFGWGTLFGDKDPITFYNEKIGSKTNPEDVLPIMSEATNTLNEMNHALNGQTIKLTFTVSASENTN